MKKFLFFNKYSTNIQIFKVCIFTFVTLFNLGFKTKAQCPTGYISNIADLSKKTAQDASFDLLLTSGNVEGYTFKLYDPDNKRFYDVDKFEVKVQPLSTENMVKFSDFGFFSSDGAVESQKAYKSFYVYVFGEGCSPKGELIAGDGVEIYQPLN